MGLIKYTLESSKQYDWEKVNSITATQAALGTAKDAVTVNAIAAANKAIITIPDLQVALGLRFITDDDADANVVNLYAMAGENDFYTLIAILTLTGGTQVAPGTSKVFCDTLVVTSEKWPTTMSVISPIDNQIASLVINTHGNTKFLLLAVTRANTLTVDSRRM